MYNIVYYIDRKGIAVQRLVHSAMADHTVTIICLLPASRCYCGEHFLYMHLGDT